MYARLPSLAAAALAAVAFAGGSAWANTVTYDFSTVNGQSTGGATPLTINGATFSSPQDPGAFYAGPNADLYSTLSAYVLSSNGVATLDISFAQAQNAISFNFANGDIFAGNGGDTLTLTTNTGNIETVSAAIPSGSGDAYPQGYFSLTGATPFTSVTITTQDNLGQETLTIGNLTSNVVPLPGAAWLLGSGLLALWTRLRRREALPVAA
jgi:hypothetical protein